MLVGPTLEPGTREHDQGCRDIKSKPWNAARDFDGSIYKSGCQSLVVVIESEAKELSPLFKRVSQTNFICQMHLYMD